MNTQELKEKADTLLALREDLYEMHFHQVDREWLIDTILDFAAMNHMYFGKKSEKPINLTSSQTENNGLDWLASHWKKLQSEGEKMNWEQIIQITELAKEAPSSQTEISDEMSKIEKALYHAWSDYEYKEGNLYSTTFRDGWLIAIEWYREQLKSKS